MQQLTRPPRVVVFDFNGTLFDALHVAYGSVQEIFRVYGIPCPTLEQYREEIGASYMEFYYNHGFPRTTTGDELNVIRNKFYKTNGGSAQIRPDVIRTIDDLSSQQQICLAIVSAETSTNLYKQLIRCSNLQRSFDFIKAEAWGSQGKEKALLQVSEVFGTEPGDMIYVDDSVDGLTSAKNVGVVPVALTNPTGYHSSDRLSVVTEFRVEEIRELINLINANRWLS